MRLPDDLLPEELAVLQRVSGLPVDYMAISVLANIIRAAQAFRSRMERTVLREFGLSWGSFSTLFIVWVWGPIETRDIAKSQSVSRATVTSIVDSLEGRGLCQRQQSSEDRRLVAVKLTAQGETLMQQVFPRFNRGEVEIAASLTLAEQETLAHLLRKVVHAAQEDTVAAVGGALSSQKINRKNGIRQESLKA